ncbi:MAG TPA: serine hydrolase, partial [Acidobacteriota bacterium]|nr:serine hydrolase [Acidobacteriota bacterium]
MPKIVRWIVLILTLLALSAAQASANSAAPPQRPAPVFKDTAALPQGPTGARVTSLIEVLNAASPERVRRFLDEECDKAFRESAPIEEHIATALRFFRDTGGIDFYSVRTFTPERPDRTVVIVKDRLLGGWWALTFRFGEAPRSLVAGLGFNSARPPAGLVEPPLTETEAVEEIRSLMARVKAKDWYSGTVLVAKGAKVLLTDFAGEANRSFHVPNNIDTKFNLGSMNKMFTSVAIARLVEAGRLSFDDPIGKWIDESWLPKDVTDKITVRHLITHTSG